MLCAVDFFRKYTHKLHANIHTYRHTHLHTHIHTYIHTYINSLSLTHTHTLSLSLLYIFKRDRTAGGWLRSVGSLKIYVSFANEPYKRDLHFAKETYILESGDIQAR